MNIQEMIQRKKDEFLMAKTPEGLQAQKERLVKRQGELQMTENLRKEVIDYQQQVRALEMAPAKERLAGIGNGLNMFKEASMRADKFFHGDAPPGLQNAAIRHSQSGMPTPDGIFKNNSPDKVSPLVDKAYGGFPPDPKPINKDFVIRL
jgi:hypothetical protein